MVLGTSDYSRGTMPASRSKRTICSTSPRNWRVTGLAMMRAGPARMPVLTTAMTKSAGAPLGVPTGRLADRWSRNGDRPRSASRKIYLDGDNDVLRRIRDVGARCREPERYYLGVLVFPKEADGRVRLFADQMVPTTRGPPSPAARRGLKRPRNE